jgi:hypothetical protein
VRPIKHLEENGTTRKIKHTLPTKYFQKSHQEKDKRNPLGFYEKQVCQVSLARSDQF